MRDVIIKMILDLIQKLVTPEVVEQAKKAVVAHLRTLAQSTDNEIDDRIVDIIAKALEVQG